jgi:hypothetical protein
MTDLVEYASSRQEAVFDFGRNESGESGAVSESFEDEFTPNRD